MSSQSAEEAKYSDNEDEVEDTGYPLQESFASNGRPAESHAPEPNNPPIDGKKQKTQSVSNEKALKLQQHPEHEEQRLQLQAKSDQIKPEQSEEVAAEDQCQPFRKTDEEAQDIEGAGQHEQSAYQQHKIAEQVEEYVENHEINGKVFQQQLHDCGNQQGNQEIFQQKQQGNQDQKQVFLLQNEQVDNGIVNQPENLQITGIGSIVPQSTKQMQTNLKNDIEASQKNDFEIIQQHQIKEREQNEHTSNPVIIQKSEQPAINKIPAQPMTLVTTGQESAGDQPLKKSSLEPDDLQNYQVIDMANLAENKSGESKRTGDESQLILKMERPSQAESRPLYDDVNITVPDEIGGESIISRRILVAQPSERSAKKEQEMSKKPQACSCSLM